jgi:hypothetical protein
VQGNGTLARKPTTQRQLVTIPERFVPRFWDDSDRRCAVVRIIKKRYERLKEDAGGAESFQRDLLVQRAAFLSIILETHEVKAAEGEGLDLGQYTQAANALSGLLKSLGLDKRIKSVTDLQTYLGQKKKNA